MRGAKYMHAELGGKEEGGEMHAGVHCELL